MRILVAYLLLSPIRALAMDSIQSETAMAETGFTLESHSVEGTQTIAVRAGNGCYTVEYHHTAAEIFSCTEPLPVRYTRRNCQSGAAEEIGQAKAVVACYGKRSLELHLKTKDTALVVRLKVARKEGGRLGSVTTYAVEKATTESKLTTMLPEPQILPLNGELPEEKPVELKLSGFASLEYERSERFGYDTGDTNTTAAQNFSDSVDHPQRSTGTLFSNLNVSLRKDQTTLFGILEVGEIYSGDTLTGGGQGARSTSAFKLRNLYLEHALTETLSARAGLITQSGDPRGFIYNDHTASAQVSYGSALFNTSLWYGNLKKNRPAATSFQRDDFLSWQTNLNFFSGLKNTVFLTVRNQANATFAEAYNDGTFGTLNGDARSLWIGGAFEYAGLGPFTVEANFIHNQNIFTPNTSYKADASTSYLADAKISAALGNAQWNLSLEGIVTPGAKTAANGGNRVLGRRRGFNSPQGASYLMTVATNDGLDDAPGTLKQSTIASLSQDEGLRIAVATATWNASKKWTFFVRGGVLATEADSALGSNRLGKELDASVIHQLTPSATVAAEFGTFVPGAFFASRSPADLLTVKYKYSF